MRAFVTGSTGLLGSNLVQLLLAQGIEVKALARSRHKAQQVFGTNARVEIVVGDMQDVEAFADELHGCDVLFHTAAYFRETFGPGAHWPALKQINVDATLRLLDAAEQQGVGKTVYVSSATVIGAAPDGRLADETTPPDVDAEKNLYRKSKIMAENAIAGWLSAHPMPVVLILPTVMIGPMDFAPTQMGQTVVNLMRARIPAIPPGGAPLVDARDVAQAMLNAYERGKSGERYIITEAYHSLADLAQEVEKASGVPAPHRRFPYPVMLVAVWFLERVAALRGKSPAVTVNALRASNRRHFLSAQKAVRELGVTFRSFEDSVCDQVQWFAARA
jgi:dihydroflavonol-4-reductase